MSTSADPRTRHLDELDQGDPDDANEAPTNTRLSLKRHMRSFWAWVLGGAVLCVTALFVVLFKLPSGAALEHSAALASGISQRQTLPAQQRPALDADIGSRLALLEAAIDSDGLDSSLASEWASRWQAARDRGSDEAMRELIPAAQTLATALRSELAVRQERMESAIKIVAATLAGLLLLMISGLLRHRSRLRKSLHRFSDELEQGADWQEAVQHLRAEPAGPQSTFDAIASGVAGVLQESDRRWQALAELSADWYWETDRQHRLVKVSGALEVFTEQGWRAEDLAGRRFDQLAFFKAQ